MSALFFVLRVGGGYSAIRGLKEYCFVHRNEDFGRYIARIKVRLCELIRLHT